jgi:surface protein
MKPTSIIQRLVVLLITLMSAIGANAQEAYACYTESNTTLTFYYDSQRDSREGTTYDLNTGEDDPGWSTDETYGKVTKVVFDPTFANARPTSTYGWFYFMFSLQSIEGISYLNSSEVTNMAWMFGYCTKLTSLDLSHFNTSKVNQMYDMFYGCENLQTIYVGNGWSTAELSINSVSLFYKCTSIVGGKGTTYDANHVDADYAHIDGGPSNPGYFTTPPEAYACYTSSNTTLTFYYDGLRSSREGTTFNLNSGGAAPAWYSNQTNASVTKVVFDPSFADARPTTTYDWFKDMSRLQAIEGISYLNTSEVTIMSSMFYNCSKLTSLDLSSFNTAKVTSMGSMFWKCSNLQTIIVGDGWNTSAVRSSTTMFSYCSKLVGGQGTKYNGNYTDKTYAHIDGGASNPGYFTAPPEAYACYTSSNTTLTFYYDGLRDSREGTTYDLNTGPNYTEWVLDNTYTNVTKVVFDPSFVSARPTSTCFWFYSMRKLTDIEGINYLNTSEVTNMAWMFLNCPKLTNLDVSHFNTSKVTSMTQMFNACSSLTSLDLSSFNTSKVIGMNDMFYGCRNLQTTYVGEGWSTAAVMFSTDMFYDCTKLVGGKGTTYDVNHVDADYAHIDGGTDNSGYLTDGSARQAYAVYAEENTMLTFYYDTQRTSREGTTYDLNTDSNLPSWFTDRNYSSVTKVLFDPSFASARPTSTFYWFMGMASLQSIEGMRYLNTSEVTNMSYMFTGCQLTNLDLRIFNTAKVTDMSGMFESSKLVTLNLSSFNTSEVTSMTAMFRDCNKLKTIFVGDEWNTNQVTSSNLMFQNCTSLVGGQGTEYKPTYPTDKTYARMDGGMSHLGYFSDFIEAYACYNPGKTTLTFYYDKLCSSRDGTTYELNTDNNKPDWYTDGAYANVTKVVFAPSFAGVRPTSTSYWFYDMENLETIEGISYLNTSEVTNMERMFFYCKGLKSLDLSSFNTSKVTNMSQMFYACVYLRTVYVNSGWSTSALTESYFTMFDYCYSLVGGNGTTFDANHINAAYAHIDGEGGAGYFTAAGAQPWTSLAYACYNDGTLTFYYDGLRSSREGTTYDLNTSKVAPDWYKDGNYAYVTKVIFDPSFADARPTSTHVWFYYMTNLQTIEGLSYLNTSEVAYMSLMFSTCTKLTSLDLSSFDTSKLIEMNEMFFDCFDLTNLNLSSFNTSKVTNMEYMFMHCNNLRTIYVGEGWNTDAVKKSTQMFYDCPKLVGGQGTTYDTNHVDKTYAHIDGGPGYPGYFRDINTGIATDLHQVTSDKAQVQSDEWYTIDGQKLSGKPTKRGVYIYNGKKAVVK